MRHLCRSRNWYYPWFLSQEPCKRYLSWSCLFFRRPIFYQFYQCKVIGKVFRRESSFNAANIILSEACICVDGSGKKAHAKRAPTNEANAKFLAEGNDYLFRSAP